MTTFLSLLRCSAVLLGSFCVITSFTILSPTATQLEGKWTCDALTKHLDSNTVLQKGCLGDLHFKANHQLNSTCSAGFFPSGTRWNIQDNDLSLADSYGNEFVKFEISYLDQDVLVLEKNSITYSFARSK